LSTTKPDYESGGQEFESLRARQYNQRLIPNRTLSLPASGNLAGNRSPRALGAQKVANGLANRSAGYSRRQLLANAAIAA